MHVCGRAELAPRLRSDVGTNQSEGLRALQHEGGNSMSWGGRSIPSVQFEGGQLLEAFPKSLRPVSDMESRFPKAVACDEAGNDDLVNENSIQARGIVVGTRPREAKHQ